MPCRLRSIVFPMSDSPFQFPDLPIYVWMGPIRGLIRRTWLETNFMFDTAGRTTISPVGAGWFSYAVSNNTSVADQLRFVIEIVTTNNTGIISRC